MRNIMVIGIDLNKDSSKKNMSVVAFVASLNGTQENKLNCTKYFSRCQIHPTDDEYCSGLSIFMLGNQEIIYNFVYQLKFSFKRCID